MSDYKEIDDQASLISLIAGINPSLFEEKSKDGKPLMSHSYAILDLRDKKKFETIKKLADGLDKEI